MLGICGSSPSPHPSPREEQGEGEVIDPPVLPRNDSHGLLRRFAPRNDGKAIPALPAPIEIFDSIS
jgi:hypothetical protein